MKAVEVEILSGYLDTFITFRDEMDVDCLFHRRTYNHVRPPSLHRLARVLSGLPCEVKIDGVTPYFVFKRKLPEVQNG